MNLDSLKITLTVNDGTPYVMKYPETVNVRLELARSAQWWGVFLSVVESFKAMKEDRDFLITAFNEWRAAGYAEDFYINVDIAVLEFDTYNSIYTGVALPEYTDNTLYFNTKFTEIGNIQKFLDGSFEQVYDMASAGTEYTFTDLQGVFDVINAYESKKDIAINALTMDGDTSNLRAITSPLGSGQDVVTRNFASNSESFEFNYIGNVSTVSYKKFLIEDKRILLPKQASVQVEIPISIYSVWDYIAAYCKSVNDNYNGFTVFEIELVTPSNNTIHDSIVLNWNDQDLTNPPYYVYTGWSIDDVNYASATNASNIVRQLELRTKLERNDIADHVNFCLTYSAYNVISVGSDVSQGLILTYTNLNTSVHALTIETILSGLIDINIANTYVAQNFTKYAVMPYDGAINGQATSKHTINLPDIMEDLKNALSVGVSVNPSTKTLQVQFIPEMFQDVETVNISEANVISLETGLNETFKYGSVTFGANDRKFDYLNSALDHNRKTTYNCRNAFGGDLDLSVKKHKAQSYDFVDTYRDDVFNQYGEDKNDGDFVLFQNVAITDDNTAKYNRFKEINASHTPASQVAAWSWLLQVVSPKGLNTTGDTNYMYMQSPVSTNNITLETDIEPSNAAFTEVSPVITLRTIKAVVKITTAQYNAIIANRDGYITVNYKGVAYSGYINTLGLDIGVNMLAELNLLEKY